jgi:hypothetical protein
MALDESDRDFVLRFTLASGSLKDLAKEYGVSYPTIRIRMDRLIARLRGLTERRPADPMSDLPANPVERGELSPSAAKSIRDLHRKNYSRKPEA